MTTASTVDVESALKVKATRLKGVTRIDVAHLGAVAPEEFRDPEGDTDGRKAWVAQHDDAMLDALSRAAAAHGGDFNSFAEWTTMCGLLYDFKDINTKRRARFADPYRAAITTVFGMGKETGLAARIQATAFVPGAGTDFEKHAWQPEALYPTESMALAPAVTVRFGGARQLFLSGVMDWDQDQTQLHQDDARVQIRAVLARIIDTFKEAGGSGRDVVRLRPILPTTDCLPILRDEVAALWKDAIGPVVLPIAGLPMPAGQFAEIQAYGLLGDGDQNVQHRAIEVPGMGGPFTARASRARDFEIVQAGAFGGETAEETMREIRAFLKGQDLAAEDVCTAFAFVRSSQDATAFARAAEGVLDPASLHLVPARPENTLEGGRLLVELTAQRA